MFKSCLHFTYAFLLITSISCNLSCRKKDVEPTKPGTENRPDLGDDILYMYDAPNILNLSFKDTVTDIGPLAHKLTIENVVSRSDNSTERGYFSGSSYIAIPHKTILNFVDKKLTFSAWIKPEVTSGSYIFEKPADFNGGGPYSLDIYPGRARAFLYKSDGGLIELYGSTNIVKNEWQHIALTVDGDTARLFYNGYMEDQAIIKGDLERSSKDLYIGTYKWAHPSAAYKGWIKNCKIFSFPLAPSLVKEMYTAGK